MGQKCLITETPRKTKTYLVNIPKNPYFKGYFAYLDPLYHYADIVTVVSVSVH